MIPRPFSYSVDVSQRCHSSLRQTFRSTQGYIWVVKFVGIFKE